MYIFYLDTQSLPFGSLVHSRRLLRSESKPKHDALKGKELSQQARWRRPSGHLQREAPLDNSDLSYIPKRIRLVPLPDYITSNRISYIYVAGVEGVGHHGVTPAIVSIAKTCNHHVVYHDPHLSDAHHHRNRERFHHYLTHMARGDLRNKTHSGQITFIEDGSFPTDQRMRQSTPAEKKRNSLYDLEWVFDALASFGRNNETENNDHAKGSMANIKFFHLNRDFYRAVNSHAEFDGSFQRHAQVLYDYLWYLNEEYERINAKKPDIWRQIAYESFTSPTRNCSALVSAIIAFVGWNDCDVDFACEMLATTVHPPRARKEIIEADVVYARQFNVTLSIPPLDIAWAERNPFPFRTVVSARVPFMYGENVTHVSQVRQKRLQQWAKELTQEKEQRQGAKRASAKNITSLLFLPGRRTHRGAGEILLSRTARGNGDISRSSNSSN